MKSKLYLEKKYPYLCRSCISQQKNNPKGDYLCADCREYFASEKWLKDWYKDAREKLAHERLSEKKSTH